MKTKKMLRSVICMLLALCLAAGSYVLPAKAADNTYRYVSLGASNTNGYGIRGYITEDELNAMLSGQVSKDDVNVYGYLRSPADAYPALIRNELKKQHDKVELTQLAISSMRAEELRVLLDNDYYGDEYTEWRFTGGAKWFEVAEPGGLDALRENYQNSIAKADLVTVDIGWNNFGVYLCNQLVDYLANGRLKWETNLEDIFETEAELAAAKETQAQIKEYVKNFIPDDATADVAAEVLAYSMLGFIDSFDVCIEKIYELNPDVQVVVLGIQNLLYDTDVIFGGEIAEAGDLFGEFIDMANYYMSARSKYADDYLYVKAGKNEHITTFLDYIKGYDRDVANLSINVKDCFDYYDDNLMLESRIQYVMADQYGDLIRDIAGMEPSEFFAKGAKGELTGLAATIYDNYYLGALNVADDTMAEICRVIANIDPIDLAQATGDISAVEEQLMNYIVEEITENVEQAVGNKDYVVDTDTITDDPVLSAVAAVYMRFYLGNSFFAHPSEAGHKQIKNAVTSLLKDPSSEKEQALNDEFKEMVINNQKALCEASETGHVYVEKTFKATTKKDGMIADVCENCRHTIEKSKISRVKTVKLGATSYTYNGKVRKPVVSVTTADGAKLNKSNYTVKYTTGCKVVGKHTVTVTFKGNYSGTVTKTFNINPKGTTLKSLAKDKKAITVKWNKQATQTTGYQIQTATNKGFTKNKKLTTVSKTGTVSKKITGLKAKTTYYVRIRTYKNVKIKGETVKFYSGWSKYKSVKTK